MKYDKTIKTNDIDNCEINISTNKVPRIILVTNDKKDFYSEVYLTPENAKNLITEYLKEVTRKAMDCIQENNVDLEDSERVLKEIEICNEILNLLRTKLDFDEYKELDLSMDAEVLELLFDICQK